MSGTEAYELYKNGGVAGLFIVLYISTLGLLIWLLIKDRSKEILRIEKLAEVLTTVTHTLDKGNQLLTYLKARDDGRRNGR